MMPKFKLFDLMLDRVDLCGAGANPDATIMLFKTKEDHVPQKKKPAAKKAVKADARSKQKQRGDEEEEEEEEEDIVTKADDDDEDGDEEEDVDDDVEEEEDVPAKKSLKKKVVKKTPAKKVAKADEDEDELEEDDDEAFDDEDFDDVPESVLKTLSPSARRIIERNSRVAKKAREEAREANEIAKAERSRRERLEFIAKAKLEIPNLTGTDDEKGELLQAIYSGTVTKKQADGIVKLLKAADAAQRTLLMSESGSRRARTDEEDTAIAEIDTLADELMAKDTKLTKAQARTKVCQDNPALFKRYKMEKRRVIDTN